MAGARRRAFYNNRDVYAGTFDQTLIQGLDVKNPAVRMLDMSRIGPVLSADAVVKLVRRSPR